VIEPLYTREELERAARRLLDAMDRQFGAPLFSMSVEEARNALRLLLPRTVNERDRSRPRREAA